jgi:hypothetical protein
MMNWLRPHTCGVTSGGQVGQQSPMHANFLILFPVCSFIARICGSLSYLGDSQAAPHLGHTISFFLALSQDHAAVPRKSRAELAIGSMGPNLDLSPFPSTTSFPNPDQRFLRPFAIIRISPTPTRRDTHDQRDNDGRRIDIYIFLLFFLCSIPEQMTWGRVHQQTKRTRGDGRVRRFSDGGRKSWKRCVCGGGD